MLINKITTRGYKSFGNNQQSLEINPKKGELILLTGPNGSGKSSLIELFEYCLYGKVRSGKKKKMACFIHTSQ